LLRERSLDDAERVSACEKPTRQYIPVVNRLSYVSALLLVLGTATFNAHAQAVIWTTNFYTVTGANFREIRQSMARVRPWRDDFDGDTRWHVNWKFTATANSSGCSAASVGTTTTITTTLPRWIPPTNAAPELKQRWSAFFVALAKHEEGHARLALAAASEVLRETSTVGAQSDCDRLRAEINQRADRVVARYQQLEMDYDRRTNHGRGDPGMRDLRSAEPRPNQRRRPEQ
jgi:predicted secreted Zn-dependent protease